MGDANFRDSSRTRWSAGVLGKHSRAATDQDEVSSPIYQAVRIWPVFRPNQTAIHVCSPIPGNREFLYSRALRPSSHSMSGAFKVPHPGGAPVGNISAQSEQLSATTR